MGFKKVIINMFNSLTALLKKRKISDDADKQLSEQLLAELSFDRRETNIIDELSELEINMDSKIKKLVGIFKKQAAEDKAGAKAAPAVIEDEETNLRSWMAKILAPARGGQPDDSTTNEAAKGDPPAFDFLPKYANTPPGKILIPKIFKIKKIGDEYDTENGWTIKREFKRIEDKIKNGDAEMTIRLFLNKYFNLIHLSSVKLLSRENLIYMWLMRKFWALKNTKDQVNEWAKYQKEYNQKILENYKEGGVDPIILKYKTMWKDGKSTKLLEYLQNTPKRKMRAKSMTLNYL